MLLKENFLLELYVLWVIPLFYEKDFLFCFGFCFSFSWPRCAACGILVTQPGVEPGPSALKAWSPNHWTAREFPRRIVFDGG